MAASAASAAQLASRLGDVLRRPLLSDAVLAQRVAPLGAVLGHSVEQLMERLRRARGVENAHDQTHQRTAPVLSHISAAQMKHLLDTTDVRETAALFAYADAVSAAYFDNRIFFRGIVEFSNVCQKNCGYCGIRRATKLHRYTMPKHEILDCARFCMERGYGTIMLQSGELNTPQRIDWLVDLIGEIKQTTKQMDTKHPEAPKGLCVALSVGELDELDYRRLFEAGASRYLLRIETSNPTLYAQLHPPDHLWQRRVECLRALKRVGFQLGTGVMIGLPGQTTDDLVSDLHFFRDIDADMIGMGPYVYQEGTPVGDAHKKLRERAGQTEQDKMEQNARMVDLTTRMYALARLFLGAVNIPATTALQALDPVGRETALQRGANILMPIVTPTQFRKEYQLYEDKPCIDEGAAECSACLAGRVKWAGKELALGEWGDPPHFHQASQVCETG
ncbi:FeFe hydrogenase maturase subunit HydE [Porphyridium purpureum]|uniref:FeFe hydrogenase maturase subunit HydE n=1 Tax=Porphyridium purpureum TaxID=35688 RepID=A0A5J4YLS6_PORPP|nr:FeFe hydrogenase maturase subunit HydE [Porphyridium purpureum]|eukprot:POR0754..scf249_10